MTRKAHPLSLSVGISVDSAVGSHDRTQAMRSRVLFFIKNDSVHWMMIPEMGFPESEARVDRGTQKHK